MVCACSTSGITCDCVLRCWPTTTLHLATGGLHAWGVQHWLMKMSHTKSVRHVNCIYSLCCAQYSMSQRVNELMTVPCRFSFMPCLCAHHLAKGLWAPYGHFSFSSFVFMFRPEEIWKESLVYFRPQFFLFLAFSFMAVSSSQLWLSQFMLILFVIWFDQ